MERKEQNRLSQQQFRQRKQQRLADLEAQLVSSAELIATLSVDPSLRAASLPAQNRGERAATAARPIIVRLHRQSRLPCFPADRASRARG